MRGYWTRTNNTSDQIEVTNLSPLNIPQFARYKERCVFDQIEVTVLSLRDISSKNLKQKVKIIEGGVF